MRAQRSVTLVTALATIALTGGSIALSTGAAYADPGTAPSAVQLVGVGSDTTQDVLNALSGATVNNTSYAATGVRVDGKVLASYDAVDPSSGAAGLPIQTRPNGPRFARPNGSGAGAQALSDSLDQGSFANGSNGSVNINGQVDFARSSSGPSVAGTALSYIPFARDAVSYAAKGAGLQQLTIDQLRGIFNNTLHTVNGVTVHPELPQSSSGTRKFFLKALGLTDADVSWITDQTVEENHADDVLVNDGDIVPFSAGSWTAQLNGIAPDHSKDAEQAGAFIGSLELTPGSGAFTAPTTEGTNGTWTPNPAFYNDATFGRDVYNVVATRSIDTTSVFFNQAIYDAFVTTGSHTAALADAASEQTIAAFGFLNEPYNGSIDPRNHGVTGGLADNVLSTALPAAPAVTAKGAAGGTLSASWKPSTSVAVTDYRVTVTGAKGLVKSEDVLASTTTLNLTGLAVGSYTVSVVADNLNGGSSATTAGATVSAKTAAKVSVTRAASVGYGATENLAVTVAGAKGASVPTGKVEVLSGKKIVATLTLKNGKATGGVVSSSLGLGRHSLSLVYLGDAKTLSASTSTTVTVVKATPKVSASVSPTRVSHKKHAKVTVTLSAPHASLTGTVKVWDGKRLVGTGTVRNGRVVVSISTLAKGKHKLSVHYLGNSELNGVTKSLSVTSV